MYTPETIPLLEFDPDPQAVIMPNWEGLKLNLPHKAVFAFLGEYVDQYAQSRSARIAGEFISATKHYPIYILRHQDEEICLCQAPVGAAAAAQMMDWLIGYGVKAIISVGSCGALEPMEEGVLLVPKRALRDEGTSYHYAPPSRYMEVSPLARQAIRQTLASHNLPCREVVTWSTDGFYRETSEKVRRRREEGCTVVEMECAALAACALLRGALWGEILFTADSLANMDSYDARDWGRDAYAIALKLALDAAANLPEKS